MALSAILLLSLLACMAFGMRRPWSDVTLPARNALVFHGRNQAYGAYRLRMNYGHRLAIACASALGLMALLATAPKLARLASPPASGDPVHPVIVVGVIAPPAFTKPALHPKPKADHARPSPHKPAGSTAVFAVDSVPPISGPPPDTSAESMPDTLSGGTTDGTGPAMADSSTAAGTGKSLLTTVRNAYEVDRLPVFPGGEAAMQTWVRHHLDFPRDFRGKDQVIVRFTVGLDGAVTDVHALTGNAASCKKAAARAVAAMPNWAPARMNGHDVPCRLALPIRFEVR